MKITPISPASFASNTYLLVSDGHAFAVDPSVPTDTIIKRLKAENATLDGILLTHGHFDHMLSMESLKHELNAKVWVHKDDAELLTDGKKNAFYDFFGRERVFEAADNLICDGEIIPLGCESIKVIHTPGHTKGSVCYLCPDFLITGDTLFSNSYGRYDLYGGCFSELCSSLERLRTLPATLPIYAGHGPEEILKNALDNVAYYL